MTAEIMFLGICGTKTGNRVLSTYSWVPNYPILFYRGPTLVILMIDALWLWRGRSGSKLCEQLDH